MKDCHFPKSVYGFWSKTPSSDAEGKDDAMLRRQDCESASSLVGKHGDVSGVAS